MGMDFYQSGRGRRTVSTVPKVWLSGSTLVFNPPAAKQWLDGVRCVEVGYDPGQKVLGIKRLTSATERSLQVGIDKAKCRKITAGGFLRHFRLTDWCYCRFAVTVDTDEPTLLVLRPEGPPRPPTKRKTALAERVEKDDFRGTKDEGNHRSPSNETESMAERLKRKTHQKVFECSVCGADWPDGRRGKCVKCGGSQRVGQWVMKD